MAMLPSGLLPEPSYLISLDTQGDFGEAPNGREFTKKPPVYSELKFEEEKILIKETNNDFKATCPRYMCLCKPLSSLSE